MIEQLIIKIFATRNAVHLEHWRTKSFSQHTVLGDLYNELLSGIDALVEAHQGLFGLVVVNALPLQPKVTKITQHLEQDLEWIAENRAKITGKMPSLDNLLQNLEGSYAKALYKLNNLA